MTTEKRATLKISLGRILGGRDQWGKLASIPKSPKMAYTIAKYIKRVISENLELINTQNNEYIAQFSTAKDGESASVDPERDPKKFAAFMKVRDEYLKTEIEVPRIEMTMDELITAIASNKGALVDESMLMEIEDFFLESVEAPKKVAKK